MQFVLCLFHSGWDSVQGALGNPSCDTRSDETCELAAPGSSPELCCASEREAVVMMFVLGPWHWCNSCSHSSLQEIHRRFDSAPDTAKTKALQTVIEMKVMLVQWNLFSAEWVFTFASVSLVI